MEIGEDMWAESGGGCGRVHVLHARFLNKTDVGCIRA